MGSLSKKLSDNEILRATFQSSLFYTAKYFCGYEHVSMKTHGDIIKALESDTERKLIVCPRGAFKTSLCIVAYSIWRLINNPNLRILLDSELFTNSKNCVREIKSHLESEQAENIFGRFKHPSNWSEASITIRQRNKSFKEASVTSGGIGTVKVGQHYDIWILDDMNSPTNSDTADKAKKVIDHYKYGQSILEPNGTIILVGTRYSELDLIQHVLDTEINSKEGLINVI